jgi:hypothetical protein
MSAAQSAEAQARLQISLRDIIDFFEKSGVENHSLDNLNEFISKNRTFGFLELSESFGECMAFIDHDELISKLQSSYNLLADGYTIERKIINKRLKFLKEDKKSDPAIIDKNENNLLDVEQKKATVLVQCLRLRAMAVIPIQNFNDVKFDSLTMYKETKKTLDERIEEMQKKQ